MCAHVRDLKSHCSLLCTHFQNVPDTHQALVVGKHDDDLRIMVPDHPPEVFSGVRQGMLGNDELVAAVVTLYDGMGEKIKKTF